MLVDETIADLDRWLGLDDADVDEAGYRTRPPRLKTMRFDRFRVPADGFDAIEDVFDDLDDYFVDYADPPFPVHRTYQLGQRPRPGSSPLPVFHGLGLHPPIPAGQLCPYFHGRGRSQVLCPMDPALHQALTSEADIQRWATTYPGVVLNLQGQRQSSESEEAAARRLAPAIRQYFLGLGVPVDPSRGVEQSPGGLWHLTVQSPTGGRNPHIHFNFAGPHKPLFFD